MAASTFEVTVIIKQNGRRLPGFPLVRRFSCENSQDVTAEHKLDELHVDLNSDYSTAYNRNVIQYPKILFYTADQIMRFHGKDEAADAVIAEGDALYPIIIDPDGFVLLVGLNAGTIGAAISAGAEYVTNAQEATAVERFIVAGDDAAQEEE